jgi:hypothetical protein
MDGRVRNMFLKYLMKHEVVQELARYDQKLEILFPTAFY